MPRASSRGRLATARNRTHSQASVTHQHSRRPTATLVNSKGTVRNRTCNPLPLRTPHTQAHEEYCDAAYALKVKHSAGANDHDLLNEGRAITATRKVIKAYLTDTGSDWSLRHIMLKIQGDKPKLRTLPTDFEMK